MTDKSISEPSIEDWEVQPYTEGNFALWIDRGSYSTLSGKFIPNEPYVALSNQSDPNEMIKLRSAQDVDDLIARLKHAREWIERQKLIGGGTA